MFATIYSKLKNTPSHSGFYLSLSIYMEDIHVRNHPPSNSFQQHSIFLSSGKHQKVLSALSSSSPEYASYIISQELHSPQRHPQKEEEEEEELLPHLLLPESIDLLDKVDRKYKKKRKKQQKKQRLRQFNDLWVRIEER